MNEIEHSVNKNNTIKHKELNGEHIAQVISYLKATNIDLGILINFGRSSLETKRVVL